MRAVNLIPRDARVSRGAVATSGSGVYVLLAGLAALVLCAAVWAIADKQVGDRQAKLARVTAQAAAAEQRAAASAPFVAFEQLARDRVQTVTRISTTRFDWAHAMREVSRVVPADVWLTSLTGASGAAGDTPTPTSSAAPEPTITVVGCTHSQSKVARLMARLRTIDGVRRIALKSSEKPEAKGDDDCPANATSDPRFTIAISFAVPGGADTAVDSTGQIPSSAAAPGASSPRGAIVTPASSDTKDG